MWLTREVRLSPNSKGVSYKAVKPKQWLKDAKMLHRADRNRTRVSDNSLWIHHLHAFHITDGLDFLILISAALNHVYMCLSRKSRPTPKGRGLWCHTAHIQSSWTFLFSGYASNAATVLRKDPSLSLFAGFVPQLAVWMNHPEGLIFMTLLLLLFSPGW